MPIVTNREKSELCSSHAVLPDTPASRDSRLQGPVLRDSWLPSPIRACLAGGGEVLPPDRPAPAAPATGTLPTGIAAVRPFVTSAPMVSLPVADAPTAKPRPFSVTPPSALDPLVVPDLRRFRLREPLPRPSGCWCSCRRSLESTCSVLLVLAPREPEEAAATGAPVVFSDAGALERELDEEMPLLLLLECMTVLLLAAADCG